MAPSDPPKPDPLDAPAEDAARTDHEAPQSEAEVVMAWATCPADRAEDLARALVEERLAACVNVTAPLVSIYRWRDQVESDGERLLIIKTTEDRREEMSARLLDLHPYDVPELLFVPVGGSLPYLDWVRDCVSI